MRARAARAGEEMDDGFCPELPSDMWGLVVKKLEGSDESTWRGVLRSVCRGARNGVDSASTPARGGRRIDPRGRIDPRVLTARVDLLRWAEEEGCGLVDDERVVRAAVEGGRLGVLQWGVQSRGWTLHRRLCTLAAGAGRVEILKWLDAQGFSWGEDTCTVAAMNGQVEVLHWAAAQDCDVMVKDKLVLRTLVERGRVGVLQWGLQRGWELPRRTCDWAASAGQLKVLQLAWAQNCPWTLRTCAAAAEGGHLEILQWARANGCPWGEVTCAMAARGGNLGLLQWLLAHGRPWGGVTCSDAAMGGHLEVLQWLRAQNCPWDEYTCSAAAFGGHLEVLQWLRAQKCPWDEHTCYLAAMGGHLEVFQWLRAQGCPVNMQRCSRVAAYHRHYSVVEWIERHT
eukprot:jgi/Tetstr1/438592/TSEL_027143.t1